MHWRNRRLRQSWLTKVLLGVIVVLLCTIFLLKKERETVNIDSVPLSSDYKVGLVKKEYILNESNDPIHQWNANHMFPGAFNLLEEASRFTGALNRPMKECSFRLMNTERLQQNHPCVINSVRNHFLNPPATSNQSYHLDYPEIEDPSDGQSEAVLYLLKNKTNGFFIECGALDGENLSNTLYMERFLNWTGILIEADREVFKHLHSRKRRAWTLPVCLSDDPYPKEVTFREIYALGRIVNEKVPMYNLSGRTGGYGRESKVQCFPLYSILLAVGRTEIDYFSLDIEGYDHLVIKTIPFDKVNITVLSVEFRLSSSEEYDRYKETVEYMKSQGYHLLRPKDAPSDAIFLKRDYVKQLRLHTYIRKAKNRSRFKK